MDRRDLVEDAKRGDHDSFETLARPHVLGLDAAGRLILGDRDLARDGVQAGFLRAWQELPALRDPAGFDVWLRRIVVRSCIEVGRRAAWRASDGDEPGPAAVDRSPLEGDLRRFDLEGRAMVVMHSFLGMGLPDMARAAAVPLEIAESRLHRSLWLMRLSLALTSTPSDARREERAAAAIIEGARSDRFERQLTRVLRDLANEPGLDYHDDLFWQTERTSQRSAWTITEWWLR